jgi:hypothetical protein
MRETSGACVCIVLRVFVGPQPGARWRFLSQNTAETQRARRKQGIRRAPPSLHGEVIATKGPVTNTFPHKAGWAPMPGGVGAASAAGINTSTNPKVSSRAQLVDLGLQLGDLPSQRVEIGLGREIQSGHDGFVRIRRLM